MKFFIAAMALCVATLSFAQPHLLKDLNRDGGVNQPSLSFFGRVELNGKFYFSAFVNSEIKLFSTDGTSGGTIMIDDKIPGGILTVGTIVVVGNSLMISLKKNDGTGLICKLDVNDNLEIVAPAQAFSDYAVLDGVLYFPGTDYEHGSEIWRTDGTTEGTSLLKDVWPGTVSSVDKFGSYGFVAVGNAIFFGANDGVHGNELWTSDGTPEGTILVADVNPTGDAVGALPSTFTAQGQLFFIAADDGYNSQIWKTDGTSAGTIQFTHYESEFPMNPYAFKISGDKVVANDYGDDVGHENFVLDLATGNYSVLKDINPGPDGSIHTVFNNMVSFADEIYFVSTTTNGVQLWKTDGTSANTVVVLQIDISEGFTTYDMIAAGQKLYLTVVNGNHTSAELLVGDAVNAFMTVAETKDVDQLFAFGDKVFMYADDGTHGFEPWISDGTKTGTALLKDLNTSSAAIIRAITHNERGIIFANRDGEAKFSLWSSDGTENGTIQLRQGRFDNYPSSNGKKTILVFDDGSHGDEPWITDGTVDGTFMIKDIAPGIQGSLSSTGFHWIDNTAYFFTNAKQLWKTDGTGKGTVMVSDQFLDPIGSSLITVFKGELYFIYRSTLWKSDGTTEGTVEVKTIKESPTNGYAFNLIAGNTKMFFGAADDNHYVELWASDGTAGGTYMVKDIHGPKDDLYYIMPGIVVNDVAYFVAAENYDSELWRSDGTDAGTFLLKDINQGSASSNPGQFVADINSGITYFSADDGVHGRELWMSDGTQEGTILVKDVNLGQASSGANPFGAIDGELLFSANDGVHGGELWQTDGTTEGTFMVADINSSGTSVRWYTPFTIFDNKFFFMAFQPDLGFDIWLYNPKPAEQTIMFDPIEDKTFGDNAFLVSAVASSHIDVELSILSGPATINESIITITGGGEVTIGATQSGSYDFLPASSQKTFTVAKAQQTIIFNPTSGKRFGDAPFDLTATTPSDLPITFEILSGPATISGNTVSITGAGDVTVKASQAGNANYLSASSQQTFTVIKATQTITFDRIPGKQSNDVPFNLTATSSSGLPIIFEVVSGPATISGNTLTITGTGDVTVRATQAGNDNYDSASEEQTFTVLKITQTITFDPIPDKQSNDLPFNLTAASSSGLPITFEVISGPATISGNTLTITGAGDVTVKATQVGDDNYDPGSEQQTFTVKLFVGLENGVAGISVYPNPASNVLFVSGSVQVKLTNLLGREVLTTNNSSIDISQLPRGMYVATLKSADQHTKAIKITLQ
jgi:ELWxxDGT repeat protein